MGVRFSRAGLWLAQLLPTSETPPRTAAAYATGVFFGFSPFLGLHTILGLGFALLFRLNRVAVLVGVYSNLPWILVPYYTLATWLGAILLDVELPPGTAGQLVRELEALSWTGMWRALMVLRPLLWAYVLGSSLGALVLAIVAYRIALVVISSHAARRQDRD